VIRAEKEEKISILRKSLESAKSLVLVDFKGMNVEKANILRTTAKDSNIIYLVVKNTLLGKAIENTRYEGLKKFLDGPTAVAFSEEDSVLPAKVINEFSKKNEILKIKGGFLDKDVLDVPEIVELSKLPSRDILVSKVIYSFSIPLVNLINVLSNPIKDLIVVLKLLEKEKDSEH